MRRQGNEPVPPSFGPEELVAAFATEAFGEALFPARDGAALLCLLRGRGTGAPGMARIRLVGRYRRRREGSCRSG